MALNTTHPVTKQNISRLPTDYEIASYKLCQFRGSEDHFPRVIICLTEDVGQMGAAGARE